MMVWLFLGMFFLLRFLLGWRGLLFPMRRRRSPLLLRLWLRRRPLDYLRRGSRMRLLTGLGRSVLGHRLSVLGGRRRIAPIFWTRFRTRLCRWPVFRGCCTLCRRNCAAPLSWPYLRRRAHGWLHRSGSSGSRRRRHHRPGSCDAGQHSCFRHGGKMSRWGMIRRRRGRHRHYGLRASIIN